MKLIFFLKYNYFLPVSEAVASVTEAVLAAAVEPAIAAIIKKIMYIKIDLFITGIFQCTYIKFV